MMNKKNLPLYIALAVPLLMILLVAAFIYLPGIGKKPQINFLYMTGTNIYSGYGQREYQVKGGHLVDIPIPPPATPQPYYQPSEVHFFVYNVSTDQASEVTLAQAEAYQLDPSNQSADGFTVERGNGGGGDPFFGSVGNDYNSWFIKGHNRSWKLNLKLTGGSYYDNFQFLGWIQ